MVEKNKYTVLVVGCHPDDVELGCGGTISRHVRRKDKVIALTLTNGEKGHHHPELTELHKSFETLGISYAEFGNIPDGYVQDDQKTVNMIEQIIEKYEVDRVYTHFPNDRHQDHRSCSKAVSSAARKVPEILLYQGPSSDPNFEPHYFIRLTDEELDKKIRALDCYQTQISKGIVDLEWVKSLAGVHSFNARGFASVPKTRYAEAFVMNHLIRGGDDV